MREGRGFWRIRGLGFSLPLARTFQGCWVAEIVGETWRDEGEGAVSADWLMRASLGWSGFRVCLEGSAGGGFGFVLGFWILHLMRCRGCRRFGLGRGGHGRLWLVKDSAS